MEIPPTFTWFYFKISSSIFFHATEKSWIYFRLSQKIALSTKYATLKAQMIFSRWFRCKLSISTFSNLRCIFDTCLRKCNTSSWAVERFSTEPIPLPNCDVSSLKGKQCKQQRLHLWESSLPMINDDLLRILLHFSGIFLIFPCFIGKFQGFWLEIASFFVFLWFVGCWRKVMLRKSDDSWWGWNPKIFGIFWLQTWFEDGIVQHDFPWRTLSPWYDLSLVFCDESTVNWISVS